MKFGVVTFPGSTCENDVIHVLRDVMGQDTVKIRHEETNLSDFNSNDCIILPGGFAYGNYLRAGAIASRSPITQALIEYARKGGYVWGIDNGFQILCESGLLPGVLLQNAHRRFICKNIYLKVITNNSAITANAAKGKPLKIPVAHYEGRYYADAEVLQLLRDNDQILFQYCTDEGNITEAANPNGSIDNIAGICNRERNVFGLMPFPERATEKVLGNTDGRSLFESILAAARLSVQ